MNHRAPHRRAFTPVELLVVIGIIAVLISVLLPALDEARQTAASAQCLSNLRQLGTGCLLHINQCNGVVPPSASTPAPATSPGPPAASGSTPSTNQAASRARYPNQAIQRRGPLR